MTKSDLTKYIEFLYKDVTTKKISKDLIGKAVDIGIRDFWDSGNWAFKEKHDTITTTAGTEELDLPVDFGGILSVIEHETDDGRRMHILTQEDYDRLVPYSEDITNGTPRYYKVYFDQTTETWRIALYPTPDGAYTLYITYHTVYQNGDIPDKYLSGVLSAIAKYTCLPGTNEYESAMKTYNYEIERLKQNEGVEIGNVSIMLDSSHVEQTRTKRWYEAG